VREFTVDGEALGAMFKNVLPHLDERQRRIFAGATARALGRGGIAAVAEAAEMSRSTLQKAVGEIDAGLEVSARIRPPGAGRPRAIDAQPGLLQALDDLVEPESRGDPMCRLRWTTKSTRRLAQELVEHGFVISHVTVGELLHAMGYSLQANAKENEGAQHPDRDAQFRHITDEVTGHLTAGQPVISVDGKKKETVGNLKNGGKTWEPAGLPVRVDVHDFPDPEVGKAVPYGVYDLFTNEGFVTVGDDGDTAAFAVASIGRWWDAVGALAYPDATRLLITADAGGSNSYRARLWKVELAKLAERTGLSITVCHFPPGTSKWNKIEHRLFSAISMNWKGRPLTSHQVVVDLIAATTTRTGLRVRAELDQGYYPRGIKVTNAELAAVPISPSTFHGEWNYTISGQRTTTE
jgi:transposase